MQRGQALLVVMLVLAVALTVGLSIVSRSVTEVSVSTTQEESARALSAAEAGVEKALGQISIGTTPSPSGSVTGGTYQLSSSNLGASTSYAYPDKLVAGDVATIKLPASLTSLRVCWDDGNNNTAMEVTIYYGNPVTVFRAAYQHLPGTGGFSVVNQDANCVGVGSYYGALMNAASGMPTANLISARLRLFYNGTTAKPLGVIASASLPAQGNTLTSSGQSGQTTQKIQVNEVSPDVPPIFDAALFSGGNLSQ